MYLCRISVRSRRVYADGFSSDQCPHELRLWFRVSAPTFSSDQCFHERRCVCVCVYVCIYRHVCGHVRVRSRVSRRKDDRLSADSFFVLIVTLGFRVFFLLF
jgi:hypothetical protein